MENKSRSRTTTITIRPRGAGSNDSVFGLALTINWKDDCIGDGTIQSQDCKDTFQKVIDDCEPKTAPSGSLLQKYGGNILGFACVNYGVEIINGNVFDPATSPVALPEASSTALRHRRRQLLMPPLRHPRPHRLHLLTCRHRPALIAPTH